MTYAAHDKPARRRRTPIAPVAWRIQYLSSCGMPCGEIFFTEDPEIVERHQSRGACEVTPLYRAAADLADAQAQEIARLRGCFERIEKAALHGCLTPELVAQITRDALGTAS